MAATPIINLSPTPTPTPTPLQAECASIAAEIAAAYQAIMQAFTRGTNFFWGQAPANPADPVAKFAALATAGASGSPIDGNQLFIAAEVAQWIPILLKNPALLTALETAAAAAGVALPASPVPAGWTVAIDSTGIVVPTPPPAS